MTHLIKKRMRLQLNVINIFKISKILCRNIIKNLHRECWSFPSYKKDIEPQGRPICPVFAFRYSSLPVDTRSKMQTKI